MCMKSVAMCDREMEGVVREISICVTLSLDRKKLPRQDQVTIGKYCQLSHSINEWDSLQAFLERNPRLEFFIQRQIHFSLFFLTDAASNAIWVCILFSLHINAIYSQLLRWIFGLNMYWRFWFKYCFRIAF